MTILHTRELPEIKMFLDILKKNKTLTARLVFVLLLAAFWQWYASSRNIMGFPPLDVIFFSLLDDIFNPQRAVLSYLGHSLLLIAEGLGVGAALAIFFSGLSVTNSAIFSIFNLLISVFDLLPGVALLPILMITVGANDTSILILAGHSVLWPMSRSILDGFRQTPVIYLEAGKNMGLGRLSLVLKVYLPASFASLLSGFKVGWARAWRGLISAEMIFGAAQSAGIGVFINNARTIWIDYPSVYAAIILIIAVGVVIEYGFFQVIERTTVKKWGMIR